MTNLLNNLISFILVLTILMSLGSCRAKANKFNAESKFPPGKSLPAVEHIPNPYKFFNPENNPSGGHYVSSPEEWIYRKEEIRELVQRYWLGYRWPTSAKDVRGETYVKIEPNEISLGFDFPPHSVATKYNLVEEFNKLTSLLLNEKVEIREIIEPKSPFSPPSLGEVIKVYEPAANELEATKLALKAWNEGYYISYPSFGSTYYAVLKDFTGGLTAPPDPTKPVTYHTITIENPDNGRQASFNIKVQTPSENQREKTWGNKTQHVPVIIDIGGVISQISQVNEQGYAHITLAPNQIYPDNSSSSDAQSRRGVYTELYPYNKDIYEYASGALMAWGWGASQILNALEQPSGENQQSWGELLKIDPTKSLVTGHSRFGKAALFAAAFDERFSICVPSEAGGSGIQSYRYKVEGKIFNFNTYPKANRVYGKTEIPTVSYGSGSTWFPHTASQFVNRDNQLPFDSSCIISLVAPRPLFTTTGIDSHWLGNEGAVAAIEAASAVYRFVGKDTREKNNISIRARESDHIFYNRDLAFVIAIMDREFKQNNDFLLHVQDLFPEGEALGSFTYPAQDYGFLSDFSSHPWDINSSYLPWSNPDQYTLWTAQENFLAGLPIEIEVHSDAPSVSLTNPSGEQILPKKGGEIFYFSLNAEQTLRGRYKLQTIGPKKATKEIFISAISLSDALRHGTGKGDEGEENRLIGFSSRIVNTKDDPPVVLVDREKVSMGFTPERFKPEETTLLEYGILFHDKLFRRIALEGWNDSKTFIIKNLKFVTLPNYTFEISFGKIYASAVDSGKEGAHRFTRPISWNVDIFNNGPAPVWPPIPDTMAEKMAYLKGQEIKRPEAPEPEISSFKAVIEETTVKVDDSSMEITIEFSEALDTAEYGFGLDFAKKWDTTWNSNGTSVTLMVDQNPPKDIEKGDLIIFHLMDTSGNPLTSPWKIPILTEK